MTEKRQADRCDRLDTPSAHDPDHVALHAEQGLLAGRRLERRSARESGEGGQHRLPWSQMKRRPPLAQRRQPADRVQMSAEHMALQLSLIHI